MCCGGPGGEWWWWSMQWHAHLMRPRLCARLHVVCNMWCSMRSVIGCAVCMHGSCGRRCDGRGAMEGGRRGHVIMEGLRVRRGPNGSKARRGGRRGGRRGTRMWVAGRLQLGTGGWRRSRGGSRCVVAVRRGCPSHSRWRACVARVMIRIINVWWRGWRVGLVGVVAIVTVCWSTLACWSMRV